jgi:DNA-binding PadR family transcriptional regulator
VPKSCAPENEVGLDISAAMKKVMRALAERPNQSSLRLVYTARLSHGSVKMILNTLESARLVQSKPLNSKGRDIYRLSNTGKEILKRASLADSLKKVPLKRIPLADSLRQRKIGGLLGGFAQLDVHDQANIDVQVPQLDAIQQPVEPEIIDMGSASQAMSVKKAIYG